MSSAAPHDPTWVSPLTERSDAEMATVGLTRVRTLYQMRRPLPLEETLRAATRRIEVQAFQPGVDDEGFLAVNNRAFTWHPDQSDWDVGRLRDVMSEDWFDADGFMVHEAAGTIDGFCWTKMHPATSEDPALGEIFVVAADPSTHGTGLGRALTVAGLDYLAGRGLQVGMLYVEHDNRAALGLYERLGFTIHHADAAYARVEAR